MKVLAVLQNMWDWSADGRTEAPLVFTINPRNYTGKKLYRVTEGHQLWVTNSSSKCAPSAKVALPPDIDFLKRALMRFKWDVFLICGAQAKQAFYEVLSHHREVNATLKKAPVIFLPHPAARMLTNKLLDGVKTHLANPGKSWVEFQQLRGAYRKRVYA